MDGGRTRRHLGAAVLLVAALGAAGLTACTDDNPSPPPSTTAIPSADSRSATPTTSPTATAPPTAPKAEPTPKSAEAFVKYFWDVYNYSYATLDTGPLQAMSKSTCRFCSGAIDEIKESKKQGLRNEGGRLTPIVIAAPPGKISGFIVVTSVLRQDAGRVLGPDSEVLNTSKALDAIDAKTRLEREEAEWIIAAVNITQPLVRHD